MKKIVLSLEHLQNRATAHAYLQAVLALPEYYGANLDALYDCLTEIEEPTEIMISAKVSQEQYLGEYGVMLLAVLQDAANDNAALSVVVQQ